MSKIRSVKDVTEELNAKRDQLAKIFEETKTDDGFKMTAEQVDDVQQRNAELGDLAKELKQAKELDDVFQKNQAEIAKSKQPGVQLPLNGKNAGNPDMNGGHYQQPPAKSLGEQFTEHDNYAKARNRRQMGVELEEFDMKTLMTRGAGFAPEVQRINRLELTPLRRPVVGSIIPSTSFGQSSVRYMRESVFTNNAAPVAEGAQKPESALQYEEVTLPVEKIATWIPVTEEQLEDVAQARSLINSRLVTMLTLAEEGQVVNGSGVSPNLVGLLNTPGIQTQAKGADAVADAVYKAMTKVRFTGFADPTAVILHPNDWQTIRLMKTTTGEYIWGAPSVNGPETVWGIRSVVTPAISEGTGFVGDFDLYSHIYRKMGVVLKATDSHNDNFTKNILVLLIEERLALVVFRSSAFCELTGLNA